MIDYSFRLSAVSANCLKDLTLHHRPMVAGCSNVLVGATPFTAKLEFYI